MPNTPRYEHYPSLLIVANAHRAKWFLILENGLILLEEYFQAKETFSDKEGFFKTSDRGISMRAGMPDILHSERDHEENEMITAVAKKTAGIWNPRLYAHCVLITPARFKRAFLRGVIKRIRIPNIFFYPGNYVNEAPKKLETLFHISLANYPR